MRNKPKFDKQKCLKCRWHGMGLGWSAITPDGKNVSIHCNYSGHHETTPLRAAPGNTFTDLRGNDFNNCLLFEEGEMEKEDDEIYDDNRDLLQ